MSHGTWWFRRSESSVAHRKAQHATPTAKTHMPRPHSSTPASPSPRAASAAGAAARFDAGTALRRPCLVSSALLRLASSFFFLAAFCASALRLAASLALTAAAFSFSAAYCRTSCALLASVAARRQSAIASSASCRHGAAMSASSLAAACACAMAIACCESTGGFFRLVDDSIVTRAEGDDHGATTCSLARRCGS